MHTFKSPDIAMWACMSEPDGLSQTASAWAAERYFTIFDYLVHGWKTANAASAREDQWRSQKAQQRPCRLASLTLSPQNLNGNLNALGTCQTVQLDAAAVATNEEIARLMNRKPELQATHERHLACASQSSPV